MFGSIAQTARDTDYVFTVDTTIEGTTEDNQFRFLTTGTPTTATGSIFWEEVGDKSNNGFYSWDASIDGTSPTITFSSPGTYRLRVPTNINWGRPYHTSNVAYGDKKKITEINNWGNHVMQGGLNNSFYQCSNLDIVCKDTPNFPSNHSLIQAFTTCLALQDLSGSIANWDVSECNNLQSTFYNSRQFNTDVSKWDTSKSVTLYRTFSLTQFNHPIDTHEVINYGKTYNAWDVSNVTRLYYTFAGSTTAGAPTPTFNQNLNNWDTSKVYDWRGTFHKCENFNGDISDWDTGQGLYFNSMFERAIIFNQDLSNWDTSKSTQFSSMFLLASNFDQDISNWDTSKVTTMASMFYLATTFNQDITNWDVSKVNYFNSMFRKAYMFNQDISDWDTGQGIGFSLMFSDAESFNQNLQSWDTSNATIMTQMFWGQTKTPLFTNNNQPLTSSYYNKHGREYLSWDTRNVTSFNYMFASETPSRLNPFNQDISNWDTSAATTLNRMFKYSTTFNQNISTKEVTVGAGTSLERTYNAWDVKNVTSFNLMFYSQRSFNYPIGNWQLNTGSDVNVSLASMFYIARAFNQELTSSIVTVGSNTYLAWDTQRVSTLYYTFNDADGFDKDISKWDTSNVKNLERTFAYTSYNQNLSSSLQTHLVTGQDYIAWDVSNVNDFQQTFLTNPTFNKSIQNWNTVSGSIFNGMFYSADGYTHSFQRQNVTINGKSWTSWDVSNSTPGSIASHGANLTTMFYNMNLYDGTGLSSWNIESASFNSFFLKLTPNFSTANYNSILTSWAAQNPTYTGDISFGTTQYDGSVGSAPSASRSQLETVNGWVITDGGPV